MPCVPHTSIPASPAPSPRPARLYALVACPQVHGSRSLGHLYRGPGWPRGKGWGTGIWIAWSADAGIYRSVGTIKAWWARERKKVYKLFPEMERMDVIMQRVRDAENADGEYED